MFRTGTVLRASDEWFECTGFTELLQLVYLVDHNSIQKFLS
jgi:hypothetical protein